MTPETAAKRSCVPAEPFARVAQQWLDNWENSLKVLAEEMKVELEGLRKVVTGKKEWISFDYAEKLLFCCGGDWVGELYDIYQSADLRYLDRNKPCAA